MKLAILLTLIGSTALCAACSKDSESRGAMTPPPATTMPQTTTTAPPATGMDDSSVAVMTPVDAVRVTMLRERPQDADVIRSLLITESGTIIELRGTVPDEQTRKGLVDAAGRGAKAKAKSLKDDLKVDSKGR